MSRNRIIVGAQHTMNEHNLKADIGPGAATKRIVRLTCTLFGILTILVSVLVAVVRLESAPPLYVAHVERDREGQTVYVARIDGKDVRALTPQHQNSYSPVWSPDGSRLAVLSDGERLNTRLMVVDVQQGATSKPLADQPLLLYPGWSPNGEWIAFSALRGGQHSIMRANVETGRLQQVTDEQGNDFYPGWSPDGQWIVFVSDRDQPTTGHRNDQAPGSNDIYRIRMDDPANSHPERLTFTPETSKSSLKWSPDGEHIAYIVRDETARRSLYTLRISTGQVQKVTDVYTAVMDWQLSWSNDGEWLYILKDMNGEPVWHRIQVNGENLKPMRYLQGYDSPAWSPIEEQNRMRFLVALTIGTAAFSFLLFVNNHPAFRRKFLGGMVNSEPQHVLPAH